MKNLQLSHGPLMAVGDLQVMIDYLLLARQRVRGMMDKGMTVEAVRKQFHMNEYKGWDREAHFPVIAATIYRELRGEGPEISPVTEKTVRGKIAKVEEEGIRRLRAEVAQRNGANETGTINRREA
jgi:hypothetical protein